MWVRQTLTLDHVIGSKVAQAYDRATRLDLRRELIAWFESRLISARDGAPVIPLQRRARRVNAAPSPKVNP
jgi:hypothetical protein